MKIEFEVFPLSLYSPGLKAKIFLLNLYSPGLKVRRGRDTSTMVIFIARFLPLLTIRDTYDGNQPNKYRCLEVRRRPTIMEMNRGIRYLDK